MGKVYCENCDFYCIGALLMDYLNNEKIKEACGHESNIEHKDTYLKKWKVTKKELSILNKNNDCTNFKEDTGSGGD